LWKVLDGFAHGYSSNAVSAWVQPHENLVGPGLPHFAQHPADGFADEELLFVKHRIRVTREPLERAPCLQRFALREKRGTADPELLVARPRVDKPRGIGVTQ